MTHTHTHNNWPEILPPSPLLKKCHSSLVKSKVTFYTISSLYVQLQNDKAVLEYYCSVTFKWGHCRVKAFFVSTQELNSLRVRCKLYYSQGCHKTCVQLANFSCALNPAQLSNISQSHLIVTVLLRMAWITFFPVSINVPGTCVYVRNMTFWKPL